MLKMILNQTICLKEYISEKEYEEIKELEKICILEDKVNLKLEMEFKLNLHKNYKIGLGNINEFLYYINGKLVAYIGISSFGGNQGELNGMTHPEWRRKGLFRKLFKFAIDECKKRKVNEILLLSDEKSDSGNEFIKAMGGIYDFSEYRMKLIDRLSLTSISSINLRKAESFDKKEIERQNSIFFYNEEEIESLPVIDVKENENSINEENTLDETTYMVELEKEVIGKIAIEYNDNSAFICGFGILPAYRGKGYGKETLKETLKLITEKNITEVELDVEGKNDKVLNLYKAFGFQKVAKMNYYRYYK